MREEAEIQRGLPEVLFPSLQRQPGSIIEEGGVCLGGSLKWRFYLLLRSGRTRHFEGSPYSSGFMPMSSLNPHNTPLDRCYFPKRTEMTALGISSFGSSDTLLHDLR